MKQKNSATKSVGAVPPAGESKALLAEVRELILSARQTVAQTVNSTLTMLYWEIGRRVREDVLQAKRAGYGEQIVATLGRQLELDFGRGFGEKNLHRMIQFATVFPDERIVASLRRQLGWTHFKTIIALDDPLKRDFYAEMCRMEQWSTRTLSQKIQSMLFERTALSKKPDKMIAADKGQMELYLNWLKRYECEPDEAEPLGMILCAGKSDEHVELMDIHKSGIHLASYLTKLLPKKQLVKKLHEAVRLARQRLHATPTGTIEESLP